MSQTHNDDADKVFPHLMKNDVDYDRAFTIVKKMKDATKEDCNFLLDFLEGRAESFTITELFNGIFPDTDFLGIFNHQKVLFEAYLLIRLGEFKDAYYSLDEYVDYLREDKDRGLDSNDTSYYRCLRDYTGLLSDGKKNEAQDILELFFDEPIIEGVLSAFKDSDSVFDNFPYLDCFNCDICTHKNNCSYPEISIMHRKLKSTYKENVIDQKSVGKLF